MTCGKNGLCRHDPRCSDHHCPGRGEPPAGPVNLPLIWLLVSVLAVLLAVVGPAIDDHSGESTAADDAIAQQKREEHVAAVSRKVCGENGALRPTDTEGSFVCVTKRGFVTRTKGIL